MAARKFMPTRKYFYLFNLVVLLIGAADWLLFKIMILNGNSSRIGNVTILAASILYGYFAASKFPISKKFFDIIVYDSGGSIALGKIYLMFQWAILFIVLTIFATGELFVVLIVYSLYAYLVLSTWRTTPSDHAN